MEQAINKKPILGFLTNSDKSIIPDVITIERYSLFCVYIILSYQLFSFLKNNKNTRKTITNHYNFIINLKQCILLFLYYVLYIILLVFSYHYKKNLLFFL